MSARIDFRRMFTNCICVTIYVKYDIFLLNTREKIHIDIREYKVTNDLPEELEKKLPSVENIQKRIKQ